MFKLKYMFPPIFLAAVLTAYLWPTAAVGPIDDEQVKRVVREYLSRKMVHPELARWNWEVLAPFKWGGLVVCGTVDFPNAAKVYIGRLGFYVLVKNGEATEGGLTGTDFEDPTGSYTSARNLACKSVITK